MGWDGMGWDGRGWDGMESRKEGDKKGRNKKRLEGRKKRRKEKNTFPKMGNNIHMPEVLLFPSLILIFFLELNCEYSMQSLCFLVLFLWFN
jgi:hypothetical protein